MFSITKYQALLICTFFGVRFFAQNPFQNSGNFRIHTSAQVGFFGDLTNNGTMTSNLGEIHLVGSALQNINGSNKVQSNDLIVNNSNNIKLDNQLEVSNTLTFSNGLINSDRTDVATEFVHFLAGASYSGATNARHIDGVVRKTGNTAFSFPIGNDANLQALSISAPGSASDHFTAYYTENAGTADGFDTGLRDHPTVDHVSNCEWWMVNRTGGSSNVNLTLEFDGNSCGVTDLSDLLVVHWNGSQWISEGNGGTTGSTAAGTVSSGAPVSSFSPFTLGSSSPDNPLPVELISFEVQQHNQDALITWQTASEINNDYFEVEKSENAQDFYVIDFQIGAGNSNTILNYSSIDQSLNQGVHYYRLKQVDYDGSTSYSSIKSINIQSNSLKQLIIYPNPALSNQEIYLLVENIKDLASIQIQDALGKTVYNNNVTTKNLIQLPFLSTGQYLVQIFDKNSDVYKKKLIVK